MDTRLSEVPILMNNKKTKAVLSRCNFEQISKSLRRGMLVDNMKETVINIQMIPYPLFLNELRTILKNGI